MSLQWSFDTVIHSDDDVFLSGLMKLVALSQEMQLRTGFYENDNDSSAILKVGRWLTGSHQFVSDNLEVLSQGAKSEKAVLTLWRNTHGKNGELTPEYFGMTDSEYYAFNTVVNRGVCQKLYKEYIKEGFLTDKGYQMDKVLSRYSVKPTYTEEEMDEALRVVAEKYKSEWEGQVLS